MFELKEMFDFSLIKIKEEEETERGKRIHKEGFYRELQLAGTIKKQDTIVKRGSLIQFERSFGFQTIITKESLKMS